MPWNNTDGQPVSSQYYAAMAVGGAAPSVVVNASVQSNNGSGTMVPEAAFQDMSVESLTVTADRANAQRTTISLVVTPQPPSGKSATWQYVPSGIGDVLAPNGNEIVIQCGFTYQDGTTELIQQGVFPVVTVVSARADTTSNGDLTITVTADDRSWAISRRALLQSLVVPVDDDGNSLLTADELITLLLTGSITISGTTYTCQRDITSLPTMQYNIASVELIPGYIADENYFQAPDNTYDQGQDPWEAATELAQGLGYELYLDNMGNVQAYLMPGMPGAASITTTSTPDWTFTDDTTDTNGYLLISSATRTLTADEVCNDIFVTTNNTMTTEPTDDEDDDDYSEIPTIQWEEWNEDSVYGITTNFGDIPDVISSSVSGTAVAAAQEATYDLLTSLGQIDMVTIEGILNPAVQIDDLALVTCESIGLQPPGSLYIVDGYTHTFSYDGTGTTQYTLRLVVDFTDTGDEISTVAQNL